MNQIVVITGQTATGKTRLAIQYAKKYNGELINCDSRQVYKYLDIITGKDKEEVENVPVHLYDVVDPKENFSSYDFKVKANKVIKDILKRGKTPIIVGGTYFYISHLLYGIETENIEPDFQLRKELDKKSVVELQDILKRINIKEFQKLNESDRNNPRRLIRRIEIVKSEDVQFLRLERYAGTSTFMESKINIELLALRFKKKKQLAKAIRQRVEKRLEQGAVEELKKLLKKGYKLKDPGLKTNGCQEIADFIKGKITREVLIDKWVTIELQYAKRQYTFMKKDKNIKWIDA